MNTSLLSSYLPLTTACVLALCAITGCEEGDFDDIEFVDSDEAQFRDSGGDDDGGWDFNTNEVYGQALPWVDTTGAAEDGRRLVSVYVDDSGMLVPIDLVSLHVDDGEIKGSGKGNDYDGADFVNSVWNFELDGDAYQATIAEVSNMGSQGYTKADQERMLYAFQYPGGANPIPTCEADPDDGNVWMVMYSGFIVDEETGDVTPRQDTAMFSCLSSAVGKPARLRLAPDDPNPGPYDSLTRFEGIIRVYRADYCGDGVSFTEPGKALSMEDRAGVTVNTNNASFVSEALWTYNGASCVNRVRSTGEVLAGPFECADLSTIPLCGTEIDVEVAWNLGEGFLWSKNPWNG